MTLSYQKLSQLVRSSEAKLGRWGWSVLISILLMGAATIYVRPATKCVALGVSYARLAADPFMVTADNALAYRILTPLISYLLGLRGELIIITNLIFAILLLVTTYLYFRRHTPKPADSLIATAIMCFSLVTLTTIYYGGYTDSATYFIIMLMWITRKQRLLFYLLFLLGLLNRESIGFLVPWFAYIELQESKTKGKAILSLVAGFGITIGLYMLFRQWLSSQHTVAYDFFYYWRPLVNRPFSLFAKSYLYQGLGLFTVFKAFWAIPLIAGYSLWKTGNRQTVYSMVILLLCTFSQMLVAYDSSRMLTLGFMIMIIALLYMFETDSYNFRKWVGWLFVGNLLIPQLYTAQSIIEVMRSLSGELIYRYITAG